MKNANMQATLFDTSILYALLHHELHYQRIEKLLSQAQKQLVSIHASEITLMELEYGLIREEGSEKAGLTMIRIEKLAIVFHPITRMVLKEAALIKAKGKISLGDAIIAGTAKVKNVPLLTTDPEFLRLKDEIKVVLL